MLQRGIDDRIDVLVTDIALEHGPELFATEARPFWEEDTIWTTRSALDKRRRELREIRDEKLPENAETLARAAAYGDLSENAEWEQAIEQQRQLTEQAKSIELELARVSLLENAPIPDDTVCPGTVVRYRDQNGEHELALLGPWDTDREHAISYKAPLAAGMLGLRTGAKTTIQLPAGAMEIEVLAVRPGDI
jgi:transcription elongation factor GreA